MSDLQELMDGIKRCRKCIDDPQGKPLPHEPRPVAVLSSTAKIRIIGQAPGTRVHASGRPFTDPSGDRLRAWMNVREDQFYDSGKIAITPMGFCFPGLDAKGGDLPPRRECEKLWQDQVDQAMPQIRLVLLIGLYAQKRALGAKFGRSLTETVSNWREVVANDPNVMRIPLPHPSWRNNAWVKKHPWFEAELLPALQKSIATLL